MGSMKQVIVVRKDLRMRKGKMCAQVAHVAMAFLTRNNESSDPMIFRVRLTQKEVDWLSNGSTKIVVGCDSQLDLERLVQKATDNDVEVHVCVDNGTTEFNGIKTMTCAAFGPDDETIIDEITGNLKLL